MATTYLATLILRGGFNHVVITARNALDAVEHLECIFEEDNMPPLVAQLVHTGTGKIAFALKPGLLWAAEGRLPHYSDVE